MAREGVIEKLERFSVPEPNSGCILWLGGVTEDGYGLVRAWGAKRLAHRVSYVAHVGPIPDGLELDHLCRVRCCINPRHLEPVTYQENQRRGLTFYAINTAKTRCDRGHELNGSNLIISADGHRHCRACTNASKREFYQRELVAAQAAGLGISEYRRRRRGVAA